MRGCRGFVTALLLTAAVAARAQDGRRLVLDVSGKPGSLTISAPSVPTTIESRLVIERAGPAGWEPQRVQFSALAHCSSYEPQPPPCIDVLPGRPIATVPWDGQLCAGQCSSRCRNNRLNLGHYRFVAKTCDGTAVFRSGVFAIGERPALPDVDSGIEPRL